jgi:hypothetical protein
MEKITVAELARRLKITEGAVRKAIKAGRIEKGFDAKERVILYPLAMQEYKANTIARATSKPAPEPDAKEVASAVAKARTEAKQGPPKARETAKRAMPKGPEIEAEAGAEEAPLNLDVLDTASLNEARRVEAICKARRAKIELQQLENSLVNAGDVYRELFAVGKQVCVAFELIPDRVTANMLACEDVHEAREMLAQEIKDTLKRMIDALSGLELKNKK